MLGVEGLERLLQRIGVTHNVKGIAEQLLNNIDYDGDGDVSRLDYERAWKEHRFDHLAST